MERRSTYIGLNYQDSRLIVTINENIGFILVLTLVLVLENRACSI